MLLMGGGIESTKDETEKKQKAARPGPRVERKIVGKGTRQRVLHTFHMNTVRRQASG